MKKIKKLPPYEEYKELVSDILLTENGNCPVMPVVTMLQGKWKLQVIYELIIQSPMRFGELRKALSGITNTMLTNVLRDLEADGLVDRIQYNETPPHVEYSLTERGMELAPVLRGLCAWSGKYAVEKGITLAPLPPSRDGKDLPGAAESFAEA